MKVWAKCYLNKIPAHSTLGCLLYGPSLFLVPSNFPVTREFFSEHNFTRMNVYTKMVFKNKKDVNCLLLIQSVGWASQRAPNRRNLSEASATHNKIIFIISSIQYLEKRTEQRDIVYCRLWLLGFGLLCFTRTLFHWRRIMICNGTE